MAPRQRSPPTVPQHQQSSSTILSSDNNCSNEQKEPLITKQQQQQQKTLKDVDVIDDQRTDEEIKADRARDHHDMFNLIALLPPVVIMLFNWDYDKLMKGYGAEGSWNPIYFMEMWSATMIYFILDLVWVAVKPNCVKSPGIIIKHHLAALVYLWGPILWPQFNWFMGVILTIEINTWFLIARRYVYKKRDIMPSFLLDFVSYMFYGTWIVIRMIIFPQILVIMLSKAYVHIRLTGTCLHAPILFIPLHAFFCLLNLKWSYDLFSPMIKKWIRKMNGTNDAEEETKIASGL